MRIRSLLCLTLLFGLLTAAVGQDRIRVFITDSHSWEIGGRLVVLSGTGGGGSQGGARPQTAEIMKTFAERCPFVTVTIQRDKADYIVVLDHEGGKNIFQKDNKVAIFNKNGDMIYSGSTRSLGNAVKDACAAIQKESSKKP